MISKMCHNNNFKLSHVLIIVIVMSFSFQYVHSTSTTNPTLLGNQLVAKVDKQIKCIDKERNALLVFKAGLQDPFDCIPTWGTKKEAVDDDDDCCNWRGVTCNNQTGHITELHLSQCALEGEISPSFLNLTYLNHLDLSFNSLSGNIPLSIGSLTKLRYLSLSGNSFNGTISELIGSLTELTYLDLSSNGLNETIPGSIGSLTELRYLDLSSNSFNGLIPMSIGSLTKLRYLDLSHNSFHGSIPTSIGYLTELRKLNLASNSFSGNIPPEFGNLVNMEELYLLDIGRCSVENISWLSRLSRLKYLNMNGISLAKADDWVNAILSLQNLTFLSLDECDLSHVIYPYSSSSSHVNFSSSNIDRLSFRNNNLNSSMYPWLYPLTRSNRLEYLYLSGNKLDGILPTYFGNLCHLTELYFNNNSALVTFPDFLKSLSAGCTSDTLYLLDASSSQFTGSISDDIQKFSSLEVLRLSYNQLNGTISEKMLELPMLVSLDISFNSLRGAAFEPIGKSKLTYIDLSNNLLEEFRFKTHMSNLNNVGYLDLSSCKLGLHFPKWIQTFKNLTSLYHLNIANNGISYTFPVDFWETLPSLSNLNLSSNNISGKASNLLSSSYGLSVLDLSSNSFNGPVTNVSSSLIVLNLSKNKFYGGIFFLCQNVDWSLTYLDLSHNSFSGQIPDCLWHLKSLTVLNLAHNNLSGRLPASVEYLIQLDVLDLYNNFSGELPLSLRNCTVLTFLDLGNNRFSGNVPIWIGENLSGLYFLSLGTNDFFGSIPLQLCQLVNLQILDLSMNNLNGTIPSCVNNLTSMDQERFLSAHNVHEYNFPTHSPAIGSGYYTDIGMVQWQGIGREFTSNLVLLKTIDLSSNNLTGKIPKELTDLRGLLTLNLSRNALFGEIPQKIGQVKKLLTLDLSRNHFSGGIPSSISEMTSLSSLDVSYNNLSGRIPSGTQLQTFEASSYTGNAGLCGLPLSKYCPGDEELQVPPPIGEREGGGDGEGDKDELERWFYIGGAVGFSIGFWIVCIALLVNRHGRHIFFHFMDSLENWVYVKVMVFKAKFQRTAHE